MATPRMRRPRRALSYAALLYFAGSCAELPEVEPNVCGNQVFEPSAGEDCDGAPPLGYEGATCGALETAAACRFTCATPSDPGGGVCPGGWGCGTDGICRKAVGTFSIEQLPGDAQVAGDLDGDGLSDLILRDSQGGVEVAFFSEGRNLAELFEAPAGQQLGQSPLIVPIVANLTNDDIEDLALPVIGDDVTVRVLMGSTERSLDNPFVDLVTLPKSDGENLEMLPVFNPWGLPQSECDAGGCRESLAFAKSEGNQGSFAVLDDRTLAPLFALPIGHRRQSWTAGRYDASLSCDLLAISYRYANTGSPGNRADVFPLCTEGGGFNTSAEPLTSLSVEGVSEVQSLVISGSGDVDGDGRPDLLINVTDNGDSGEIDDGASYVLYGSGDGHFNARADQTGAIDLADAGAPLIREHPWMLLEDDPDYADKNYKRLTWARALEDINGDGRADFLLAAGVVVLSTADPADRCVLDGEVLVEGPPIGLDDAPQWGYACLMIGPNGLGSAASADPSQIVRDYGRLDSLARPLQLRRDALPAFAALAKAKVEFEGSETDHSGTDFLDLLWISTGSGQLVLETLSAERFELVAAGDIDGDFENDLILDDGERLEAILGAPFELSRAISFSPTGFSQLELFSEGLPSASLGAERDGRLTVLRKGQWPALALLEPGECAQASDCHVRFAAGALDHPSYFVWGLGVVQSSEGEGLRLLRPGTRRADFGPAYDSSLEPLVPLAEIGISVPASQTTVISVDLDAGSEPPASSGDGSGVQELVLPLDEAVVIGRVTQLGAPKDDPLVEGVEVAVLRPTLRRASEAGDDPLCSSGVLLEEGEESVSYLLCYDLVQSFFLEGRFRPVYLGDEFDPFVEVADPDDDGKLDLTLVTANNSVVIVPSDGAGGLDEDQVLELVLPPEEEAPGEGEEGPSVPGRIDWVRWIEVDGSPGRELISGDYYSGNVWSLDAGLDIGELRAEGYSVFPKAGERPGVVGDVDGDGIDDIAIGSVLLFGVREKP